MAVLLPVRGVLTITSDLISIAYLGLLVLLLVYGKSFSVGLITLGSLITDGKNCFYLPGEIKNNYVCPFNQFFTNSQHFLAYLEVG